MRNLKENGKLKNNVIIVLITVLTLALSFAISQNETIVSSMVKNNLEAENEFDYGNVLKSQAKIECDKTSITALEDTNEIELTATLITDNQEFCKLYKNPVITISVPDNVTIVNIGDVVLLGETKLQISNSGINENKIRIEMTGEQITYKAENLNAQIKIPATVSVNKMIKNAESQITMLVQNQNDTETRTYTAPINVESIDGIIGYAKVENYNSTQDVLECYNNSTENIGNLEMDADEKTVTISGKILNNHNIDLTNVKLTFAPKWIHANGTEERATIISEDFTNDEILVENFEIGQVVEFTAQITIPEDLYYNEKLDLGFNAKNIYQEQEQTTSVNITLQTEQKAGVGTIEKMFTSEAGSLRIETLAQVGNNIIVNNDNVQEGSTIRYTMNVTNLTETLMENVKIKMTRNNNNTKIYDLKYYDTSILDKNLYTYEEIDDETIEKVIGNIEAGEIKTIYFEVVVGNDTENKVVANTVDVFIGENTQQTSTISNNIIDSDVKLNLTSNLVKTLEDDDSITIDGEAIQLVYNLEVINLKGEKINEDSYIEMELPSYVEEVTACIDEEAVESTYEDGKLIIPLNKIDTETKLYNIYLMINQLPSNEENLELTYKLVKGETTYYSNKVQRILKYHDVNVEAFISSNIAETTSVNIDEPLEYTIAITNRGEKVENVSIYDSIPYTLTLQSVTINDVETTEYEIDEFNELNIVTPVEPNEQKIVKIKTTINGEADIENSISVMVDARLINEQTLNHRVYSETFGAQEIEVIEEELTGDEYEPEMVGNYIKGKVWLDANKDGNRADDEQMLSGIKVRLLNADKENEFIKDEEGNPAVVTTNEMGEYEFNKLDIGNYFVLFEYDTENYETTQYQRETVDVNRNSDVEDYKAKIDGKEKIYAITKTIEVNDDVENIDMGLVEAPKFDLKVDKYISRATVKNKQGTTNYEYKDKNTVKVEIPGKYMNGSVVITEYTIRITNVGDVTGYVTNLIDYLPNDMKFNTELNKDWFTGTDGNLHNTSLSNIAIEPGKSTDVTLVLSKTMTKDNTGTTENKVEIGSYSNTKEKIDINLENNKAAANLIVSVKTGELVTAFVVVLASVAIIGAGIYIIKRKVIN